MQLPTKPLCLLATLLLLGQACSDVLVPDISDKLVTLLTPTDQLTTHTTLQEFYWEPIDGAKTYQLKIVSPSFDSIEQIVAEHTTENNQFELTLPYGHFEWRVVAFNDAYTSDCCITRKLTIQNDSSTNLSTQNLLLLQPADHLNSQQAVFELNWQPLGGAEHYLLEVGNAGFSVLFLDQVLAMPGYLFTAQEEGEYFWRVRAVNETSLTMTAWQTRSFVFDKTPPSSPDQLIPIEGDTIKLSAQNPDLKWLRASDVVTDSLVIYNNAQRDIVIFNTVLTETQTNLDSSVPAQQNNLEDYFWEVFSTDKAGNISAGSGLRKFFIRNQ